MATKPIGQPRFIDPSLIELGDDIAVEHKINRGIIETKRGIVGKRVDNGSTRYLMTEEGATLLAWEPGKKTQVRVTLYGREENPQVSIFDIFPDLEKRVAS